MFSRFPSSEFPNVIWQAFPAVLYHSTGEATPSLYQSWVTFLPLLKVATGPAAAGASSAEASKTSAAITVVAITTATSVAASAATHEAAEKEEDQADVAGLDEEEEQQQDGRAAEHNLSEA